MTYRLFGSELSPYSVKVRSYFRYKGLPHEWLPRSPANQAEFQKYAKLPLVPLVVTPTTERRGRAGLHADHRAFRGRAAARPSIVPDDPALAFISALLEEYGDEWGNKWMFHYRWAYRRTAGRPPSASRCRWWARRAPLAVAEARAAVAERMSGRLGFVGSNPTTRPLIEASFKRALAILDGHLADACLSVRRPAGAGRFRPVGAALRMRPPTRRRAPSCAASAPQCDGLGRPHGVSPRTRARSRPGQRLRPA